jgi:threonine dehydrogenase-like Zn-dependent dehydrogenase
MSISRPIEMQTLGIRARGEWSYFTQNENPPQNEYFLVKTMYSGISAGTEFSFLKGTNPYLSRSWNQEFGLFEGTAQSKSYPLCNLGYMEVSKVIESHTSIVKPGDVLAMSYGHKTAHFVDPQRDYFVTLPSGIRTIDGIFVARMGPTAANALLHAAADLNPNYVSALGDGIRGRNILITGSGTLSLLTALFCRHNGAGSILLADNSWSRLETARRLNFDTIDWTQDQLPLTCKKRWYHRFGDCGADIVFQCRSSGEALNMALRSCRPQGTIIDLAFYQAGIDHVRLGEEFHHNAITVRCSQISRVPRGLTHQWNLKRLSFETISLLRSLKRRQKELLISSVIPFEEASDILNSDDSVTSRPLTIVLEFK